MRSIKALVSHNEWNKVDHYERFEIWDGIPEVGTEVGGQYLICGATEVALDCEAINKNPEVASYDFYLVSLLDEVDGETNSVYIAVERSEEMKTYFDDYGELEWIEPEQYYAGDWRYEGSMADIDGEKYDIVFSKSRQEYRFTVV